MKKTMMWSTLLLLVMATATLSAQELMTKIASYQDKEQWIEGYNDIRVAITKVSDNITLQRAYAELASITMEYGDEMERQGKLQGSKLADIFSKGEQYGLKSAQLGNPKGYFWAAANLGRWAQTKGILQSLTRAEPMRQYLIKCTSKLPNDSDSWELMGKLYFGLSKQDTGMWDMKFGSINKTISFDRVKFDTSKDIPNFGYLFGLAEHLSKRKLSASARMKKRKKDIPNYNSKKINWEKNEYYEGMTNYDKLYYWSADKKLKDLSDIEEAKLALNYIINQTQKMIELGTAKKVDLRRTLKAQALLNTIH